MKNIDPIHKETSVQSLTSNVKLFNKAFSSFLYSYEENEHESTSDQIDQIDIMNMWLVDIQQNLSIIECCEKNDIDGFNKIMDAIGEANEAHRRARYPEG